MSFSCRLGLTIKVWQRRRLRLAFSKTSNITIVQYFGQNICNCRVTALQKSLPLSVDLKVLSTVMAWEGGHDMHQSIDLAFVFMLHHSVITLQSACSPLLCIPAATLHAHLHSAFPPPICIPAITLRAHLYSACTTTTLHAYHHHTVCPPQYIMHAHYHSAYL